MSLVGQRFRWCRYELSEGVMLAGRTRRLAKKTEANVKDIGDYIYSERREASKWVIGGRWRSNVVCGE